jgi:hypothetical protein
MWFWPVSEMIELVSGMPAHQFGKESSEVLALELVQSLTVPCFVLINLVCFRIPPKMFSCTPGGTHNSGWRQLYYRNSVLQSQHLKLTANLYRRLARSFRTSLNLCLDSIYIPCNIIRPANPIKFSERYQTVSFTIYSINQRLNEIYYVSYKVHKLLFYRSLPWWL